MNLYSISLIDQYGNLTVDTVHALGYEVADQFVHFWSSPAGYCASFRIDSVMKIKEDVVYPGCASDWDDTAKDSGTNHELWYKDDKNHFVRPVTKATFEDAFKYSVGLLNSPAPLEQKSFDSSYDPELVQKLSAMSESWDVFPEDNKI